VHALREAQLNETFVHQLSSGGSLVFALMIAFFVIVAAPPIV